METFTTYFNQILSICSIVLGLFTIILLVLRLTTGLSQTKFESYIANNKLLLTALISFTAMICSLIYSNIIGYPPCWLCWLQRIFIYPTAVISIMAIIKNEDFIIPYIKALISIALFISLFHIYIYYTGNSPLPCDASASCTARYVFEFGFMTIPLMSFVTLSSILTILWSRK